MRPSVVPFFLCHRHSLDDMGKPFYGLRGTQLNIAIAVVAGVDFALFGYDQVFTFIYIYIYITFFDACSTTTNTDVGCHGYDSFPFRAIL